MNIVVDSSKLKYDITLSERVSFLYDKSGTGKTKLCDTINSKSAHDVSIITDMDRYRVSAMIYDGEADVIASILDVGKQVVVLDEDAADSHTLQNDDIYRLCNEKDNYIIIISRDSRINYINKNKLLFSYHIVSGNKRYITVEPPVHEFYDGNDIDVLVCEDSSLGLTITSDSMGMIGCSSNGNSNMINIIKNHLAQKESVNKSIGYVVDGSVFTGYYVDIIKMLKLSIKSPNKISLFMPPSFEYLVLKSSKLCDIIDQAFLDINYVKANVDTTIESIGFRINEHNTVSAEVYYTELLKYIMKKKLKFNYDKSKRFPEELGLDLNKFKQELYKWKNCYWLDRVKGDTKGDELLSPNEFLSKFS